MYQQSKKPQPKPQYSRDTQVLRSIEAQSATSMQQNQVQNLIGRLFLLSIQIDRKDCIIRELMQLASGQQSKRVIQSLQQKCSSYQLEIKNLNDIVAMLKENISSIEISKQRQMFASVNQFSQQLESKVVQLEKQLRKTMEEKIDLEEQLKQIRLNQTLAEFNSFKNQHNEKGRVRQLQGLLSSQRVRFENQKKALFEKGQLIEQLKKRVIQLESRQKMVVGQYEQKLRAYQNELYYTQNLKKSQIVTTEQRINIQAQQITTLQEDIRTFKITNDQLKQSLSKKDQQISKLISDCRSLDSKTLRMESQNKEISYKFQLKADELRSKQREISQNKTKLQKLTTQIEQFRFSYATTGQQAQLYLNENNRIKVQAAKMEATIEEMRQEIRRLKRKPMSQDILCEGCKARQSSSLITSQKSIKSFNISQIIEQTQQLFKSNRKIQQLINKHDLSGDSSIQMYQSRAVDM